MWNNVGGHGPLGQDHTVGALDPQGDARSYALRGVSPRTSTRSSSPTAVPASHPSSGAGNTPLTGAQEGPVTILHTSSETEGQIYVPFVNWAIAAGCVGLVLAFGNSSRLAAAYGIA